MGADAADWPSGLVGRRTRSARPTQWRRRSRERSRSGRRLGDALIGATDELEELDDPPGSVRTRTTARAAMSVARSVPVVAATERDGRDGDDGLART